MGQRHHSRSYRSTGSSSSTNSNESLHTQSTAITSQSTYQPHIKYPDTCPPDFSKLVEESVDYQDLAGPRSSLDTYTSTVPSTEDLSGKPEYQLHQEEHEVYPSDAVPSSPSEFAELFPSRRKLLIHHDDSTSDGNMNLRVDTDVETIDGDFLKMTLFHLKMQDLRERKFSLRRYCRDSGREVCSSSRKYLKPHSTKPHQPKQPQRPLLSRSLSSALHTLGSKTVSRSLWRSDSGYESDGTRDLEDFTRSDVKPTIPSKTVKLEFANYAQVEVRLEKTRTEKRYCFEYWGCQYHWSRDTRQERYSYINSYQLTNTTSGTIVARIENQKQSRSEALKEAYQGGWVAPSELVICDRSLSTNAKSDVADVIVATGLIVLVDDSIRRHWHSNNSFELEIPRKNAPGYTDPGDLINEIFNRHGYTDLER